MVFWKTQKIWQSKSFNCEKEWRQLNGFKFFIFLLIFLILHWLIFFTFWELNRNLQSNFTLANDLKIYFCILEITKLKMYSNRSGKDRLVFIPSSFLCGKSNKRWRNNAIIPVYWIVSNLGLLFYLLGV